jgi:hypothetical protein
MGKVIVMNWVTLDGVMQGPGHPNEDTRDGFEHGGLMIAPLVLGIGRRLFAGGVQASLGLLESTTTRTGVVMATYERARG